MTDLSAPIATGPVAPSTASRPVATGPVAPSTASPPAATGPVAPSMASPPADQHDATVTALEARLGDPARREIEVTIIRPGTSANGLYYSEAALRASLPLWEGAAAFLDHPDALDLTRAGLRSLRDLVGVYRGVHYHDGIRATLAFYPGAAWAYDLAVAALVDRAAGRPTADIGISADMRVQRRPASRPAAEIGTAADRRVQRRLAGRPVAEIDIATDLPVQHRPAAWEVERIVRVISADLVFQPSAGGSFDRVIEGADAPEHSSAIEGADAPEHSSAIEGADAPEHSSEGGPMLETTTRASQLQPTEPGSAGEPRIDRAVEARAADPGGGEEPGPASGAARLAALDQLEARLDATLATAHARLDGEIRRVEEARRATCAELLRLKLGASELPEPARAALRTEFADRLFEAEELDERIGSLRTMLGAIFGAPAGGHSAVRGMGAARPRVQVGASAAERVQAAVDRLFGVPLPDALSDVPRLAGIREAYLTITGDHQFTGRYDWDRSVVREANEVTTSVLANTIANAMTKRIERDYAAQPKWWEPLVVKTAIGDFKQQQRIHLNDFAALSVVAENAAYTNLAWGDTRETYQASKRGNLVVVTLEMIVNDDTGAVVRIPQKLAASAVVTINEFVSGLFTANGGAGPLMSDTFTVFDATNHQANATTAALSSSALQAALIAMLKFTNSASKRIGVVGRYLLTPPDLHFAARVILDSILTPGTTNNDVNPVRGALEPISVPNWTDTNNWYVLASPAQVEGIELGFLNGREEPELIVQDSPSAGSVFTNDALSWKVRHVFGGAWLDFRAAYGAIVP